MKRALVTGGTSGIGLSIAQALLREGYQVVVAARGEKNVPPGALYLPLDVTDEDSVASLASRMERMGGLDVLVQAAGSGIAGAAEDTPLKDARAQFDVGFFGVLAVNRALLPLLRKSRGRLVLIGSLAGRLPIPYQSHYSASKFALEAYALALRMETARLGVSVTVLEPGDTRTGFTSGRRFALPPGSPYEAGCRRAVSVMERDEESGAPPEVCARAALRVLRMRRPPARCAVGASYRLLVFLTRLLPDRLILYILRLMYQV